MFDLLRPAARMLARRGSPAIALVTAAAFAACSDSTASRAAGGSQLGFTTTSSSTSSAPGALASVAPITKNGHTIDLTQVTVVIDHAQLKRANTDACSGDDDEHDAKWGGHVESCASARVAPTLVDLPLDGKVVTLPMNALPAGTFREIELRISLARLVGKFDGNTFDVTIPVETKAEIEFATPLVVSDTAGTSITVNLPIADWLTNADGSLVDPRQLLTDQKLLAAVRSRIMESLKAFEDNDHDGKSDHDRSGHD